MTTISYDEDWLTVVLNNDSNFENNYRIFSFLHSLAYAFLLLSAMKSLLYQVIKSNMKIDSSNKRSLYNLLLLMLGSLFGIVQFSNFHSIHWSHTSFLSNIAINMQISFLYLLVLEWIDLNEKGLIQLDIISLPDHRERRNERIQHIINLLKNYLKVYIFLIGFIPDIFISLSNNDHSKNFYNALTFLGFSFIGLRVVYKLCKVMYYLLKKQRTISPDSNTVLNKTTKGEEEEERSRRHSKNTLENNFKQKKDNDFIKLMIRNSFIYLVISIVSLFGQFYYGFKQINNVEPFRLTNSRDIFTFNQNVDVYCKLALLIFFTYNSYDYRVSLKSESIYIRMGILSFHAIWLGTFLMSVSLIWNEIFPLITVICGLFMLFLFPIFICLHKDVSGRQEELAACINYVAGKRILYRNYLFVLVEIASLTFVSLDSVYLWWSPDWYQTIASYFYNGISLSNIQYLKLLFPNISSSTISNILLTFTVTLGLSTAATRFLHLPPYFINTLNYISYLTYDIGIMFISSLLLGRIKCHNTSHGLNSDYDSVCFSSQFCLQITTTSSSFTNTSLMSNNTLPMYYLVGYENIKCDTNSLDYIFLFDFILMSLYLFLGGYSLAFITFVRNKTSKPRIWIMPGINGLKTFLKFIIVCVIHLTPQDAIYSRWIRSLNNLLCTFIIFITSYLYMPCLGPQSEGANLFRTTGYALSFFSALISLISLIILATVNTNSLNGKNTSKLSPLEGNILSLFTAIIPILGSYIVYLVTLRRKHSMLTNIHNVCDSATKDQVHFQTLLENYQENIDESLDNPIRFLPALALHYKSDSLLIKSLIEALNNFISISSFNECNFQINGIPNAFNFISQAIKYSEGIRIVYKNFADQLVRSCFTSLQYFSVLHLEYFFKDTHHIHILNYCRSVVLEILSPLCEIILQPCITCIYAIANQSKYYKRKILTSYPAFIECLLLLRNYLIFLNQSQQMGLIADYLKLRLLLCINSIDNLLNLFHQGNKGGIGNQSKKNSNLVVSVLIKGREIENETSLDGVSSMNDIQMEKDRMNKLTIQLTNLPFVKIEKNKESKNKSFHKKKNTKEMPMMKQKASGANVLDKEDKKTVVTLNESFHLKMQNLLPSASKSINPNTFSSSSSSLGGNGMGGGLNAVTSKLIKPLNSLITNNESKGGGGASKRKGSVFPLFSSSSLSNNTIESNTNLESRVQSNVTLPGIHEHQTPASTSIFNKSDTNKEIENRKVVKADTDRRLFINDDDEDGMDEEGNIKKKERNGLFSKFFNRKMKLSLKKQPTATKRTGAINLDTSNREKGLKQESNKLVLALWDATCSLITFTSNNTRSSSSSIEMKKGNSLNLSSDCFILLFINLKRIKKEYLLNAINKHIGHVIQKNQEEKYNNKSFERKKSNFNFAGHHFISRFSTTSKSNGGDDGVANPPSISSNPLSINKNNGIPSPSLSTRSTFRRKSLSSQANKILTNFKSFQSKDKILLIIGFLLYEPKKEEEVSLLFSDYEEEINKQFMEIWNSKENTLKNKVDIQIDIQKVTLHEESSKRRNDKDGIEKKHNEKKNIKKEDSVAEDEEDLEDEEDEEREDEKVKDYLTFLSSKVNRILLERNTKREMLASHGIHF